MGEKQLVGGVERQKLQNGISAAWEYNFVETIGHICLITFIDRYVKRRLSEYIFNLIYILQDLLFPFPQSL